jgi:hypothetical protein
VIGRQDDQRIIETDPLVRTRSWSTVICKISLGRSPASAVLAAAIE